MIDLIWFNVVFLVFFESLNHADQVENHKSNNCWAVIFETCCLPYMDPYKKMAQLITYSFTIPKKTQAFMDRLDRLIYGRTLELVCVMGSLWGRPAWIENVGFVHRDDVEKILPQTNLGGGFKYLLFSTLPD